MNENAKKWINFLKTNINSADFVKYCEENAKHGTEAHKEYLSKEKPKWINRTDYYDGSSIRQVIICDVLTNDGISKLIKKAYSLSRKKYKIENRYIKPSLTKKYDYIHLDYSSSGYGELSTITFLKDKYIDKIEISWGQINNYFALVEYKFIFKNPLKNDDFINFIIDKIDTLNKKDYLSYYFIFENNQDHNFRCLKQSIYEIFEEICQHYISSLLFSEYATHTKLPIMIIYTREKPIDIDTLYLGDMSFSYYNKEENFVVQSDIDSNSYSLLSGGNHIPNFYVLHYMHKYNNFFFYFFFGEHQIELFEQEYSRYASGRKNINEKKLLKLIMILGGLKENQKLNNDFYENLSKEWDLYRGCDKIDIEKHNGDFIERYKKIYTNSFEEFKMRFDLHNNKIEMRIAMASLLVAGISLIVSLILLFVNK